MGINIFAKYWLTTVCVHYFEAAAAVLFLCPGTTAQQSENIANNFIIQATIKGLMGTDQPALHLTLQATSA
jgi:hypothetical protein